MERLKIYTYVDGTNDIPFFDAEHHVQLSSYDAEIELMGTFSISGKIVCPVCLDSYWNGLQYVMFRGERYFIKNTPSSEYSNESVMHTHDAEFISEKDMQLGGKYFIDAVTGDSPADSYKSNSTDVVFFGDLNEFVARLNAAAAYAGLDYTFVVDDGIVTEAQIVSFTDKYILDAMKASYDIFHVPFYFVGKVGHFGHTNNTISTVFKYGADNQLLKTSKQNANKQIVRSATGTGSSDNIPYYYPNNSPKGNIDVSVPDTNETLLKSGIEIVNYEKFANGVDVSEKVTYDAGAETGDISTYIWRDGRGGVGGVVDPGEYIPYDGKELENTTTGRRPSDFKFRVDIPITKGGKLSMTPFVITTNVTGIISVGRNAFDMGVVKEYSLSDSEGTTEIPLELSGGNTLVADNLVQGVTYYLELVYNRKVLPGKFSMSCTVGPVDEWEITSADGTLTRAVSLSDIGIRISGTPADGDSFSQILINKIPPAPQLMPPIYRETYGAQRYYKAENGVHQKKNSEEYYSFVNEHRGMIPSEGKITEDGIKPTIRGIVNSAGQPINKFLAVAFDENDNDEQDENGNYIHSYFFVKLPKFDGTYGFSLFDSAIEDGAMTVSMDSGVCGGCKFTIGVDTESGRNIVQVDDNGDLMRDAEGNVLWKGQAAQDRQNDTKNYEVWVALKKEYSTFGVVMPNATNNYRPKAGDTFVLLNILLPEAYILNAENELKYAILDYIEENNVDKFNFTIDFSRIYIAENKSVEQEIKENTRIYVEYNGITYEFQVLSYSYNVQSDSPLPEIKVSLTKEIPSRISARNKYATNQEVDSIVSRQFALQPRPAFAASTESSGPASKAQKVAQPLRIIKAGGAVEYDGSKKEEIDITEFGDGDFVTLSTDQTITGVKTVAADIIFGGEVSEGVYGKMFVPSTEGPGKYYMYFDVASAVNGETPTASGGGLDVDELWTELGGSSSNKVIAQSHIPDVYVKKSGDTMTGGLTVDYNGGSVFLRGAENPLVKLETGSYYGYFQLSYAGILSMDFGHATGKGVYLNQSGNVGIGTLSPAYKLDVAGRIRATSGITIGSTDDYGWYITSPETRISAGLRIARDVNVGSLLVSNLWADYTKVPTHGIYSKGNIWTGGRLYVPSSQGNQVFDIYVQ